MQNALISKQIRDAKDNFNYFFMSCIVKIIKSMLLLASILVLNVIFDNLIVYIITLLYTLYTLYKVYNIINMYKYILDDIKSTLYKEKFYYIIDTNKTKNNLFNGVVKYEK